MSGALSAEVERSEKKAKSEEDAKPVAVAVEYYTGLTFIKAAHPSELPLATFHLFVKSSDPSELPIPKFLKTPKADIKN